MAGRDTLSSSRAWASMTGRGSTGHPHSDALRIVRSEGVGRKEDLNQEMRFNVTLAGNKPFIDIGGKEKQKMIARHKLSPSELERPPSDSGAIL